MAYTSLKTDGAPQSIKDFVKQHVDMQMHDVHTMLRLALVEESGMEGGCNFASVSCCAPSLLARRLCSSDSTVQTVSASPISLLRIIRGTVNRAAVSSRRLRSPRSTVGTAIPWCTPWQCPPGSPGGGPRGGLSSTPGRSRSASSSKL
jgi:hypothetical protein